MALTDSLGQGIPYALLTDAPNAQTLGEGIVNGVVDKLVMRFNSASHRGAVITQPTAGMVTWLRDVGRLELYNGVRWVTVTIGDSDWTDISLAPGWQQGGDGAPNAQYRLVSMSGVPTLIFRGCATPAYPSTWTQSYVTVTGTPLPVGVRPSSLRRPPAACSRVGTDRTTVRLDIRPDGEIRMYDVDAQHQPAWVSFDGISVAID